MPEELPFFKYHPNPIETGSIKVSQDDCICCNEKRGFIYQSSIYTKLNLSGSVCPWCIADGRAAEKFEAVFSDDYPLFENKIPDEIISEVVERTPGFNTWQQEVWLSHCKDACEFHGDVSEQEIKNIDEETFQRFRFESEMKEEDLRGIIENYPYSVCIYKFVCRHCGEVKYQLDFT